MRKYTTNKSDNKPRAGDQDRERAKQYHAKLVAAQKEARKK